MADVDAKAKLAGWANPPKLEDLKNDYVGAESAHNSHVAKVEEWLSNLNGDQKIKSKVGRSKIVPKLIRRQAEWRYAALSEPFLSTDDLFNTSPNTFEDKENSAQNGQVLNYQFKHQIDKTAFIDEYVRACTDEGTVVVKIGWDSKDDSEGIEVRNQPTLECCDYNNIVIDPTCQGDFTKAEFIIHSFETSLSELKKDGRYVNLDKVNMSAASGVTDTNYKEGDDTSFEFQDKPRKKFVAYEYHGYWDYDDTGEVQRILVTWAGDVIIRMEESPFPFDGLPFEEVQYLPVRKSNYGEPDGELLKDNQAIVGAVTRGIIDSLGRSANGQAGIRKDALDKVNSKKFENGDDFKFNSNIDPNQAFWMGKFPEISRSAIEVLGMQNNDAESMSGVKAFSNGISGQALGNSVGGIRSALDATAKRELGILRRLANGMVKIGYKIMAMNQEWLSDEEIIRVTNKPVKIVREELSGEYDITLNISTPEADAEKARGLEFMLQTAGETMPFEFKQIILTDIAKLKKQPELAERIATFEPQPDPVAQHKAQLEIALLEAQVFNEQAKGRENQVDVGLKQAKTETEIAKSRKMHSESDQNDLNFVEQESGVDRAHEEEMKNLDQKNSNEGKLVDSMINDEQSAGASKAPGTE